MESFDAILKGAHDTARGVVSEVQADTAPAPSQEAPKGETSSTTETPAAAQPATTADDDDGETPSPDVYGKVPLKALESERAKRQDWKTKAIQAEERQRAAEEKLAAHERERQAAAAPPAQQVQQQPAAAPQAPNPVEDPEGFHRHQQQQANQQRLNMSEMMLRQQHQDVDDKLKVFMAAAKENPSLLAKANAQTHPWGWMYEEAQRLAGLNEIGTDPKAYREKLEAEIRAKVEQERRDAAPVIDQSAKEANPHRPPPSLAAARSSGSSKAQAAAWTGHVPLAGMVGANAASVRR